ncbi:AMP-binding protein [Arsenicicoccus dermatophilus]|uniref:AMP-binding protein n=1 Tax=Arsenicicoccus dermatophilus TaxID=1076331 RepID=UPI0039175678
MTQEQDDSPATEGGGWTELAEVDIAEGVIPRLRQVVLARPDAPAVSDEQEQLSNAELARRAAGTLLLLRRRLADLDPAPTARGPESFGGHEPVAMCCGHTVDAVATLVAVIASGHPVLVLDPRTPGPRLAQLVEQAGARLVLVDADNEPLVSEVGGVAVPLGEGEPTDPAVLWDNPPAASAVACLAFTSGSTGAPKPVANDHRLLVRDAWNSSIATHCYSSEDTIAHTLPIAFHAGLTTTVHGLLVGAPMRLYDTRSRGIAALPAFVAEHGCTLMITSPAILRALVAAAPDPAHLRTLRNLTVAGEPSYGRDVEAVRALLPAECFVRNRYGSSETGLIAEYVVTPGHPPLDGPLPIGRGVGWTVLSVVPDPEGDPAIGRLSVTAPDVALGYWGLPEATGSAFTSNPDGTRTYLTSDLGRRRADGVLEIVGRCDHSVKIRGYLVDPGEVDAALSTIDSIRESVVVSGPRPTDGRPRLVAYVVPQDTSLAQDEPIVPDPHLASTWRQALRAHLPAHMVPEAFVLVAALPRNDRGKLDRSALPAVPAVDPGPQRTSRWEQLVAEQWAAALEQEVVIEPESDFFGLGGDSLAAEALMARLVSELGIAPDRAKTSVLAQAPTLSEFAAAIREERSEPDPCVITLVRDDGAGRRPIFFVAGAGGIGIALRPIALRLDGRPAYALQNPVLEGRGLPSMTVRGLARRYLKAVRAIQPEGPYHLAGHSFGGIVGYEMCRQLHAAGQQSRLVILDSFPPDPALQPAPVEGTSPVDRVKSVVRVLRASLKASAGATDAWRFAVHADSMARAYAPPPWHGPTLVVLAQSPEKDQRSRWAPHLTGAWEQVEIAGDHFTLLREPWAAEVAEHLRRHLG